MYLLGVDKLLENDSYHHMQGQGTRSDNCYPSLGKKGLNISHNS